MLYDSNSARLALGCMMIQPSLCLSDKYPLDKSDFESTMLHMRLYQAIVALAKRGAGSIGAMDIYGLCKNNAKVKAVFDANNLSDFIDAVKSLAVLDNYELYWSNLRKCSLIRSYDKAGFDIIALMKSWAIMRLSLHLSTSDFMSMLIERNMWLVAISARPKSNGKNLPIMAHLSSRHISIASCVDRWA